MSTSYQNIDVRLVGVENALMFIMQAMRVKKVVGSPLDPNPIIREMSMWDHYREELAMGLLTATPEKPNAADDASESESDPDQLAK